MAATPWSRGARTRRKGDRQVYERRDGRWCFVRRRHDLWCGAEVGVNPLTLPPADWPEHDDGMGTVPSVFPTWGRFWS